MTSAHSIAWWKPETGPFERDLVLGVLASNYLNDGEVTTRFEGEIASRIGAKYAVAVTSGTAAIYLSLMAIGVGQDDEVIVPDLSFIATANAVRMTGAKVVLVDVSQEDLTMDPCAFERAITSRTKAVIPVHVSGRAGTLRQILSIANKAGVQVVEDAAEAFCSKYSSGFLGLYGVTGCFSFSPNKTITTGQGGVIVTADEDLYVRLRELKDQGRPVKGTGGDDIHRSVGFNFKLTNLQAAVGLGQLNYLTKRLERQKANYQIYRRELEDVRDIRVLEFKIDNGECPQWTDAVAENRNELDKYLTSHGAHCRRFWHPIHTQKPYSQRDDLFPNSTRLAAKAIWLPSAFQLCDEDVECVCSLIQKFYRR